MLNSYSVIRFLQNFFSALFAKIVYQSCLLFMFSLIFLAMRNETMQRIGNKLHLEATRKSSKGSSRSSTPNEKKESGSSRNDERNREESRTKRKEKSKENSRQNTPTDRMFEDNAYFDVMDYLPPHLVCCRLSQHFHDLFF